MRTLRLLKDAVAFQAKHPVLRSVTLLLLILPALLRHGIARFLAIDSPILVPDTPAWEQPLLWATFLLLLLTSILELWGVSCVLVTGKRLLGHPAGRNRRSFSALTREGVQFVPALLLTSILRICTVFLLLLPAIILGFLMLWHGLSHGRTLLLTLLLALPAIFYMLHTAFFAVIVVGEGIAFRSALRRSREALQNRKMAGTTTLLLIFAITFAPGMLLDNALGSAIPTTELSARGIAADAVVSIAEGIGVLLSTLALTFFYATLRSHTIESASLPEKKLVKKKRTTKAKTKK